MIRFATYALAALLTLAPQTARADGAFLHASPDLTVATPCSASAGCAFSWTLASRMGHILRFAEARYGPRDRNWTLLGVEFTSRPAPQVWYPTFDGIGDSVIVQLTRSAATDETRALFQLSHEVVHLLSPAGPGAKASVLEEGLATYTSLEYLDAIGKGVGPGYISSPRYEAAYRAISPLAKRPDFESGIRMLRTTRGGLSNLKPGDLQRAWPGISARQASVLAADF